jgi:molybdenum cofactor cytidylyltransferase
MTAGILLAAGQSRRFGGEKQLAVFQGKTLLARSAQLLVDSHFAPRIVVLSGQDALLERRYRDALADLDVQIAVNPAPAQGMSSSIRIGLHAALQHAATPRVRGAIITVCDQVFCTAAHLRALESTALTTGAEIVASGYSDIAGVPAYFASTMFAELENLEGDRGAAFLIRTYRERCRVVLFPLGSVDVDTANDLKNLR